MSDSALSLTFDDIRQRLGLKRGFGPTVADWDAASAEFVEMFVKNGCDKFYNQASYEWSFLKPLANLVIATATTELVLPSEFAFLDGDIYFDSGLWGGPLVVENEAKVLLRRQIDNTTTGRPMYGCITPNRPAETHGQQQILAFWPISDQAYTIHLRYSVLPDALSTKNIHPYGGRAHSQTIMNACLAAMEEFDGQLGVHTMLFKEGLASSIDHDRKVKAQTIGYNGNHSFGGMYNVNRSIVTYTDRVL